MYFLRMLLEDPMQKFEHITCVAIWWLLMIGIWCH